MRKIDKFKIGSKPKTAIEDTIKRESLNGRISTAMTGNLASERLPSIFDAKEITERDKALLKEVKEWDVILGIDRRNKPVILSNFETRLIYALSFEISKELTTSSDVKSKVKNALSKGNPIKRTILVSELSKLIFGSKKKTYKDKIFNGLLKLSKLRQIVTITKENGAKIRLTAPLILIGETYEVLSEDSNTDTIEIIYGSTFFHRLEERYAVITPLLFEVWRKNGRGTDLFSTLLSAILSVYWQFKTASIAAEKRVKRELKGKQYTKEQVEEAISQAKREALSYELNVSSIKNRVPTDYQSSREMKKKFWKDLNNAIEGFKDADLITDAVIHRGARGQEKVTFILSETYNNTDKQLKS